MGINNCISHEPPHFILICQLHIMLITLLPFSGQIQGKSSNIMHSLSITTQLQYLTITSLIPIRPMIEVGKSAHTSAFYIQTQQPPSNSVVVTDEIFVSEVTIGDNAIKGSSPLRDSTQQCQQAGSQEWDCNGYMHKYTNEMIIKVTRTSE